MKLISVFIIALSVFGGLSVSNAVAHGGATGIVKQRMDQMVDMKHAMKAMTAMFRGKTTYQPEEIRRHAGKINQHSATAMTELFPHGSLPDASEAKAEIWEQWDKFSSLAEQLQDISQKLIDNAEIRQTEAASLSMTMSMSGAPAAENADMLFEQLTDTCAACHQSFRAKK